MQSFQFSSRVVGGGWPPLILLLFLAATVSGQQPLWNEAAGDNLQLGQMFAPPPTGPMQQGPSQLEMWQQQQAGIPSGPLPPSMIMQQQQQQQQQMMNQQPNTQSILTELAVALLRAAAAPQGGMQPQQQQSMMPMQAPQQQPYRNLYGAQPQPQQQSPQAMSFLAQETQQRDTILPLSNSRSNSYGFSVPPADVAARLRARRPKPISDVERFSRLPTQHRSDPRSRWEQQRRPHPQRSFSLERTVARHPNRHIPPPPPQKTFHLTTIHPRISPFEMKQDDMNMKKVVTTNPFGMGSSKVDSIDELSSLDSPALLAFQEADNALKSADETMDTTLLETKSTTMTETKTASKSTTNAHAGVKDQAAGGSKAKMEFAQPSADFSRMFRSIMKARKANAQRLVPS